MRTKSFGFEQAPFNQGHDLKFLYKSPSITSIYKEVLADFKDGDKVIIINGEPGIGKTFLLQALMRDYAAEVKFYSPGESDKNFQDIVNGLCNYLSIETQGKDFFENIIALDNYLNNTQEKSFRLALVIDDADQFDEAVLKKILMLAVTPSDQRGALQIVFAGPPEIEAKIQKIDLPDESKIKISSYSIRKLTTSQVGEFIDARLAAAGNDNKDLFSPDAIVNIAMYSKGRPDLINKLCTSALAMAFETKKSTVTKNIIEEVIKSDPNPLSVPVNQQQNNSQMTTAEEKNTIEKLHLRVVKSPESDLTQEPEVEQEPKSGTRFFEYAWGLAAVLLLLVGMFFYGPGSQFFSSEENKELLADAEDDNATTAKNMDSAQQKAKEIDRSDQALMVFEDASDPKTSLENLEPLLMPNKKSLFQKVLTLPGATLFQQPKVSQQSAISLPAFSAYYVYLRIKDENSQEWLQVGLGRKGELAGWVKENKVQNWNQGLTLAFRNPKDHDRVMLFKDKDSLAKMVEKYDFETYQTLYKAASNGKVLENSPVVAIQPENEIDIHKNFYLLPIHDYEEVYLKDETARLLQVSSISSQSNSGSGAGLPENSSNEQAQLGLPGSYKAGITFVIDSTLSMQPYINRTRKAVAKIYARLKQAKLLGRVNFGLVSFRDNIDAVPGIEYVTRRYVSLKQGENPQTFMSAVNNLQAAEISSQDFIEDSYAGISSALNNMNWSPHAARYIILITDAGAREADDPLSTSHLDAARLRKMAQENGAAIFVMHLLTSDPQADHGAAAKQYRALSNYPDIGNLYYAVPPANVQEFGEVIESLAQQITDQVAQMNGAERKPFNTDTKNQKLAALQQKVAKLGHALELKYLQNTKNEKVPAIFKAWVLDKDFNDPKNAVLDVRALLSRDQLSDLHEILRQVLETARQGQVSPKQFLNELKSLAATLVRDPKQLGATTATTAGQGNSLAEMGFMREYIEDLPYTGDLMNLTLEDWQSWSAQQQEDFLNNLQDKINYYRMIHDNLDLWVSLEGNAIDGDAVFPVPLEMLP